MKCWFDVESSGLPDFNAPPTAPHQPRLVQLAAILTDDDANEISTINLLVRPDGWTSSPGTVAVHGITTEHAAAYGLPVKGCVGIFVRMAQAATTLHAYNAQFDMGIMLNEISRIKDMPNPFRPDNLVCEMLPMTDICRLPGNYSKFKWPKLAEAYQHVTGHDLEDAHDALADVRAMIAVHKWRMAYEHGAPLPPPQPTATPKQFLNADGEFECAGCGKARNRNTELEYCDNPRCRLSRNWVMAEPRQSAAEAYLS